MPRSSKWSLSLRFPHQDLVCTSHLHHMCCVPYSYYSPSFYHLKNVWSKKLHGTEHWTQLAVTQFPWNKRLITIFTKAPACTFECSPHLHILSFVILPWYLCLCVISGLFSYKRFSTKMSYACFLQAAWIANTLADLISLLIVDASTKWNSLCSFLLLSVTSFILHPDLLNNLFTNVSNCLWHEKQKDSKGNNNFNFLNFLCL